MPNPAKNVPEEIAPLTVPRTVVVVTAVVEITAGNSINALLPRPCWRGFFIYYLTCSLLPKYRNFDLKNSIFRALILILQFEAV
jgi:hypothetical protein